MARSRTFARNKLYLQIGKWMALVNLDAFADKKNGYRSLCVLNKCISQSKMLKSVKDVSTSTLNSGSNGKVILYRNVRSKLIDNSETFLRHQKVFIAIRYTRRIHIIHSLIVADWFISIVANAQLPACKCVLFLPNRVWLMTKSSLAKSSFHQSI